MKTKSRNQHYKVMRWSIAVCVCTALVGVVLVTVGQERQDSSGGANQLLGTQIEAIGSAQTKAAIQDKTALAESADSKSEPEIATEQVVADDGAITEHEAGVVLVKLPDGKPAASISDQLSAFDFLKSPAITQADLNLGWATLELADGISVQRAVKKLEASGVVSSAQPNYVYRLESSTGALQAATLPDQLAKDYPAEPSMPGTGDATAYPTTVNDTLASSQWALDATHADEAYHYAINTLHVSDDASYRPSIAVVDSGCHLGHDDLKDNIVSWYDAVYDLEQPAEFYDIDPDAHGTHVCGIASARTNNNLGIAGMGGNSGLVPIRVFTKSSSGLGASSNSILRAYRYIENRASTYHIKVVNLSLGSAINASGLNADDHAVLNAIDEAARNYQILTVSSAGNDGARGAYADFPTSVAETGIGAIALRITSTSLDLGRASYSNYNQTGTKSEQLSAPGADILSTNDGYAERNFPSSTYVRYSGTSMAAPCVSGIAALVWSARPSLSTNDLKSVLFSSATDIVTAGAYDTAGNAYGPGFDLMTGFGCVNALEAVKGAAQGLYLTGASASTAPGVSVQLAPSAEAQALANAPWTWSSSDNSVATVVNGVVTGIRAGSVVITATSQDSTGNPIELAQIVTVHGTVINGPDSVELGETIELSIDDSPANNATWIWESSNPSVASVDAETGIVTGHAIGSTTITARLSTNPNVTASKTIDVARMNLSGATVSLSPSTFTYDGTEKIPTVTVIANGIVLTNGTDYTVTWPTDRINSGLKSVTVTGIGSYTGTRYASYTISPARKTVYRVYHPKTGEHHYTSDAHEVRVLTSSYGWRSEGIAWYSPSRSNTPVHRLYQPRTGEHHYTTDTNEVSVLTRSYGWRYEGIGWYSADSSSGTQAKVHRLYHPGLQFAHHYTMDQHEVSVLTSRYGWIGEGVGWYSL